MNGDLEIIGAIQSVRAKRAFDRDIPNLEAPLRFEPLPIIEDKTDTCMCNIEYLCGELDDIVEIALVSSIYDPVPGDRVAPLGEWRFSDRWHSTSWYFANWLDHTVTFRCLVFSFR
jgi:hypothetical protein